MIAPETNIADRPNRVTLQNPGPSVPNGDGGSTQTWFDLVPLTISVKISTASAQDLERVAAGTVLAKNTYIIKGPYHPQVTTKTRILDGGRRFNVTGVSSPDERHIDMEIVAVEIVA